MGRKFCIGSVVAVILAGLAPPAAGAATYSDSRFVERTMAGGLARPVGVTWAPNGRMFVVEKWGVVKTLPPGAPEGATPTTLYDFKDKVNDYSDRGLLGVAVDGQFATNPYLYLAYTAESNPLAPDTSTPTFSRLVQVRLTPDGSALANPALPERTILGVDSPLLGGPCPAPNNDSDCLPSDGRSHSIGTVRSAPDGTLYLGSGDGAPDNEANSQALRSLDERSLAGKIVHIDRNGNGLPGHSFCPTQADLTKVCTKLFAKGLRNPFRFHLRPGGGLTVGDVGWGRQEEVDLLDGPGANLGWPCHEGNIQPAGYRELPECAPEYDPRTATHRPPDFAYAHQQGIGGAIVGGPEQAGGPYPESLRGGLFYGDFAQGFLKYLERDSEGELVERPFATNWVGTDLEVTPRGDLAYVDVDDFTCCTGSIKRIAYSAPVARISANPTFGAAPLRVFFDGRGSTAPLGQTLSYAWDFDGNGTTDSTSAQPERTYPGAGRFDARLTVTASGGQTATETVLITPGNTPPGTPVIDSPAAGSTYRGGQSLSLRGRASDAQDGTLSGSALQWQLGLVHREHTHPLSSHSGTDTSAAAPDDHDADSHLVLTLTATDSGGLSSSRDLRIDPRTAPLRLRSSPSGAVASWADRDLPTPFDGITAVGFKTSVSAPESFTSGGRRYLFAGWSDGGARLHQVTVPDAGISLTASYRLPGSSDPGTTPPKPSPSTPAPEPEPEDRSGPRLSLGRFDPQRGGFSGRADDASGVARVRVALLRRAGRRCRFLSARRKRFGAPRSCRRPQYMTVRLRGSRWRLVVGRTLPVGVYRLLGSARDGRGNVSSRFADGRSSLRLRVRLR